MDKSPCFLFPSSLNFASVLCKLFNISIFFSQFNGPTGTKLGRNITWVVLNILHHFFNSEIQHDY